MHSRTNASTPDLDALKSHQQKTWAVADFGRIEVRLQIVGESPCEAVDLRSCDNVLDVAAGNGSASVAAARRHADVTSTDYVPELLEQGLRRAGAYGLAMRILVADAEDLPFGDDEFDVALSTFGVMFAPKPRRAAANLSAPHWIDQFRRYYGPIHMAFAGLGEAGRRALHQALLDLLERSNRSGRDALIVPADYLEVVIRRA
jgi:SAM-dependent methyltransferase